MVGVGDNSFLTRMELETMMKIKSLYLAFSIDDVPGATDLHRNSESAMQQPDGSIDNLKVLGHFAYLSDIKSRELPTIWWYKFSAICWLALDSLTLDMRNAYGPDGEFLANADWVRTLPWFRKGVPPKFTILTPHSVSADHIRAIFDSIQP